MLDQARPARRLFPGLTDAEVVKALKLAQIVYGGSDWARIARPEQLPPPGDWLIHLILAGRGWGKTITGAQWIRSQAMAIAGTRWAVVAPTAADCRDTCIEGETGLLNAIPHADVRSWNKSLGQIVLTNGSRIQTFSAEEPDRLRGPQHHGAWVDELASFRYPAVWDQLQFGLRLGRHPQVVITTTPRPTKLIRELRDRALAGTEVILTTGSTFDNAANLAPSALAELRARYEGTRLGRQELEAHILEDSEGSMWSRQMVEDAKTTTVPEMARIVVSVDPAASAGPESDLTGIVVAGLGVDGRGYVLWSGGVRLSPEGWAVKVATLYRQYEADRVIAEKNQGGDMVRSVLQAVAPELPITLIHASRGKRTRAEPVAALFEQGRVGLLV